MSHVWFTSDIHIGHRTVAMARGYDKNDGDELDVEAHDAWLAESWDANVSRHDQVWVLGDLSAGGTAAQHQALRWIGERPGTKHLIAGNHDGCHPAYRDAHKWQDVYLMAFASVQPFARRRIAGVSMLMSHFPYQGRGEGRHSREERFTQYRLPDLGEGLLHGHTHSSTRMDGWQIHVGVERLVDAAGAYRRAGVADQRPPNRRGRPRGGGVLTEYAELTTRLIAAINDAGRGGRVGLVQVSTRIYDTIASGACYYDPNETDPTKRRWFELSGRPDGTFLGVPLIYNADLAPGVARITCERQIDVHVEESPEAAS